MSTRTSKHGVEFSGATGSNAPVEGSSRGGQATQAQAAKDGPPNSGKHTTFSDSNHFLS